MEENNNIVLINEQSNIAKYEIENIKKMIYKIRGRHVILDCNVAMLYNYKTKDINKIMKRNINRFPEDFCFQLTLKELEEMSLKKNKNRHRNQENTFYVYTEEGIAMLSGLLRNETAIQISITIMRTFVEARKFKFYKDKDLQY